MTAIAAVAVVAAAVLVVAFVRVDRSIVGRFEERKASLPSRTYATPYRLSRGARVDASGLIERLIRLGYREVRGEPEEPGELQRRGSEWLVFLHAAEFADGARAAFPVELRIGGGRLERITDRVTGDRLDAIALEPEPLFTSYADVMEERRWTPLEAVPEELIHAVEAVEDQRFRRHHGVDVVGLGRALLADLRAGEVVQGGSTITQQLAKNLYGPGRRTLRRKLLETAAAAALELRYDKDAILEAYLNEVYLGQTGPVAISGVGDASQFFFGAQVRELDLARSALLAAMIRSPGGTDPRRHPDEARSRRNLVLELMREQGRIDEPSMRSAMDAPLGVIAVPPATGRLPWVESYLAAEMEPLASELALSRAGYSVFTTFDEQIQHAAEEALDAGLDELEGRLGRDAANLLEGAVIVLRPADGGLLALVGGRDYGRSQYNRAKQALRPPGSTFKPFVFLAAFDRSLRDSGFEFTTATLLDDEPLQLQAGGRTWSPANSDRRFRGPVTVREALEQSLNVPTVRSAMAVGLPAVVEMAHRCGIDRELEVVPSLALGAEGVTPLELAAAYATIANGGWRALPHGLVCVIDRDGARHGRSATGSVQVIEPGPAYLITDLLEGVIEHGTARSARTLGFSGVAAGKTGSSDGLRDAWFVGYTPEVLALVWVGSDDNRSIGLTGAEAALPIWVDLMRRIGAAGADPFPRPADVVEVRIDPATGQLATSRCPDSRDEVFIRGTEPDTPCETHAQPARKGFWKRLFGRRGKE